MKFKDLFMINRFMILTLKIWPIRSWLIAGSQFLSVVITVKLCNVIPNENGDAGLVILSSKRIWISLIDIWTFLTICATNFSAKVSSAFGWSKKKLLILLII